MASDTVVPVIGDIVTLISGGPPMTVEKLANVEPVGLSIHCVWFNPEMALARAAFPSGVLTGGAPPVASSSKTLNKSA